MRADRLHIFSMRKSVLLLVGMCLFSGGVRGEEELVIVEDAPKFDLEGAAYVKVVWKEGVWEIFDKGELYAQGRTDAEINKALKELREKEEGARFVIVAGGEVTFGEIKKVMRGAEKAGFLRVDFLVRSGAGKGANHSFHVDLPDEDEVAPKFAPLFIRADAEGRIFMGRPESENLLETDLDDHAMPKLGRNLETYAAAVKSAGTAPQCEVYVEDGVAFKRFIHLMAVIQKYEITDVEITEVKADNKRTCDGMNSKSIERKKRLEMMMKKLPIKP